MLHKIRTLIQNNSNFVQALAAVVQTLIALCMLLTLIQNAMTLSVTSRQLESSIEPVLDLAMYGKNLKVTNSGLATIRKLEETSLIVGHYDITSQKISDYIAMIYRSPLCDEVGVGNSYVFDLSHYKQFMPSPTAPESLEVYLLVLQYRRAVDMKPFIKLVPFMSPKIHNQEKTCTCRYFTRQGLLQEGRA